MWGFQSQNGESPGQSGISWLHRRRPTYDLVPWAPLMNFISRLSELTFPLSLVLTGPSTGAQTKDTRDRLLGLTSGSTQPIICKSPGPASRGHELRHLPLRPQFSSSVKWAYNCTYRGCWRPTQSALPVLQMPRSLGANSSMLP